jgi:hypothetical protein
MKDLRYNFIFIIIISAILFAGCSIGIKPRAYDDSAEGEDAYYEESVYDPYYGAGASSRSYRYYDPGYDPWTMGNYYQHYSGHYSGSSSGDSSSSSSGLSGNRSQDSSQSPEGVRSSGSSVQSKAPGESRASLRRERANIHERTKSYSESASSSITSQKTRRDSSRGASRSSKDDNAYNEKRKRIQRRSSATDRSSGDNDEDEDKEKQKRESQD